MINGFIVEESKDILRSAEFSKLTIHAISEKAGFKSKSAYYQAFKNEMGMTPKQFASSMEIIIKGY